MVLGPFLRNGFLHRTIREQGGAYGGGAGYNSDTGAFRFFSYRDPRLQETLADFDRALDWLQTEPHEARELEEAILGVISDIDRPDSPAGEAIGTYFATLHGRTPEQRRRFRSRVLHVSLEDLRQVGERHLVPDKASVAVISDPLTLEQSPGLGLEIRHL
jgi:Zn-dependent M16 (insulinase) family peptidase